MRLKIGIIGLGIGEAHLQSYRMHPGCEVKTLCDFSASKRRLVRQKYPSIRVVARADDVLRDPEIDVVSIASYDLYHGGQVAEALECGKHVFVEKPLCLYVKEARKIRRLLESRKRLRLSSNLALRKVPRFIAVRNLISRGILGKLYYIEGDYNYGRLHKITGGWRGNIPYYSVVYGGGIHLVDLIQWFAGSDRVLEVKSYGNRIVSNGSRFRYNDCVISLLRFKSGMIAKVASNFGCVFPHFHALHVYGTKATFSHNRMSGELFRSRDPVSTPEIIRGEYPGDYKGGLAYDFVSSILQGRKAEVTEEDVFRSMSICFAMEEASSISRAVKVRYI